MFAAVVLGATTLAQVTEQTGLSPKQATTALRRLRDQGVIAEGADGLAVVYDRFRELARSVRESKPAAESYGSGDEQSETVLRTFVRDGRLVRLPAQWERKLVVLRHIAERTFEPGVEYPERTVNEKLRAWCEDAPVDHVTLRRYLVDLHHLHRRVGVYPCGPPRPPEPRAFPATGRPGQPSRRTGLPARYASMSSTAAP